MDQPQFQQRQEHHHRADKHRDVHAGLVRENEHEGRRQNPAADGEVDPLLPFAEGAMASSDTSTKSAPAAKASSRARSER